MSVNFNPIHFDGENWVTLTRTTLNSEGGYPRFSNVLAQLDNKVCEAKDFSTKFNFD